MKVEGRIDVGGTHLGYDQMGSGEPLVHGTGADATTWERTMVDLADRHRVVGYDRRGYGRSVHRPVRDHRIHVVDLAAVIDQSAPRRMWWGWSSGGNVALALAVERPELIRSLTIVEAPFHGLRKPTVWMLAALAKAKAAQLPGRPEAGATAFYRWASGRQDGSNDFDAAPAVERARLLAHSRVVLAELDPHPIGVMVEHVPLRRLASLQMPVTWLLGAEIIPWYGRLHARVLATAPRIRTEHIAGAGHLMHLEAPRAFRRRRPPSDQ